MRHFFDSGQKQPEKQSIAEAIRQAQIDLDSAYRNLDHALDPDLIDCYIYQLKSAQMRYHFLLHCARDEITEHAQITSLSQHKIYSRSQQTPQSMK